jgi:hypothetical protein
MIKINKLFSGGAASHERVQTLADLIRSSNKERGVADDRRTREILQDALGRPIAKADAIIRAGQLARGEIEDVRLRPKPGSFAEKVLIACRKRDGLE